MPGSKMVGGRPGQAQSSKLSKKERCAGSNTEGEGISGYRLLRCRVCRREFRPTRANGRLPAHVPTPQGYEGDVWRKDGLT